MSIAAIAQIEEGPSPANSGVSFRVQEDGGVRFPSPPFARFTALIFVTNQAGPLIKGENCEEVTVLDIVGDTFTVERAENADERIDINAGHNVSLLRRSPIYRLGETVTLAEDFGAADAPYLIAVTSPNGELGGFGTASGVEILNSPDDGEVEFSFTPDRGGEWYFRWESNTQVKMDGSFLVEYSPTLVI